MTAVAATTVRNTGMGSSLGDGTQYSTRLAFTLSNGNALVVIRDRNLATAAAGYGDRSGVQKIYIYESSDRSTWTLRATITPPANADRVTAALFPDNSVAVWSMDPNSTTIYYWKVTYSTWGISTRETVVTAAAGSIYRRFDGCVTDTNVPILGIFESQSAAIWSRIYTRRTSDNAWTLTMSQKESSNGFAGDASALSLQALGGSAASRATVYAVGDGVPSSATDYGIDLYTLNINETTGALATVQSMRQNYALGEADSTVGKTQGREIRIFRTATDEYTLCMAHGEVNRHWGLTRGTYAGTTWTQTIAPQFSYVGSSTANLQDMSMAIAASNDNFVFFYSCKNVQNTGHWQTINYTARVNRVDNTIRFTAGRGYFTDAHLTGSDDQNQFAGGDRNLALSKFDMIQYVYTSSTTNRIEHQYASPGTVPPTQVTPANGSTSTSSNPSLSVKADTDRKYKQTQVKIEWQFAKDSIFTTNLITYTESDSQYQDIVGTDKSGVTVTYTDALPALYLLSQGTWYIRARLVDEVDQRGPWSTTNTITISHPPSATNLAPSAGTQFAFTDGSRSFSWKFSDPSPNDYQTAFQIIVERNDTGATVLDTGKVTSLLNSTVQMISATYKDLLLQWKIRLWDRDDVAGAYSDYALFTLADPPTIAILTPVAGGVVTSGVPSVNFTLTVGGIRTIKAYTVSITQGNNLIWSKSKSNQNIASGTNITETGDKSYLANLQSYTVTVTATDNTGLTSTSIATVFSTSWITPAAPVGLIVDTTNYNVEDAGYVRVTWADTGRDPDFSGWVVYRRDNMIDPRTNTIVTVGAWKQIYTEFNISTGYVYQDYLAPSGYQVDYRVVQQVNRFGDVVESSNTNFVSVIPVSDGYWLVTPASGDLAASAYRLANITADSYTDEWESETYTVIGRGRHVDKGQRLGWNGQLTAQLRDSATQTARQKKIRVETIREQQAQLWLRNPFGDTFPVSVGDIQVSRIAGTGKSEFVDLEVPYSEVGV